MIVIRTNHDLQTSYLYESTKEIIKFAENKNFKVNILEENEITEQNIRKRIKTRKPSIIFFNGHGSTKELYDNNEEIFISMKSADVFKDTITFARACDSLKELGKEAVKKGCYSFIGYKNKFFIARYHDTTCKPKDDPVAKPILECSNNIVKDLIKNKTVNEAINNSHELTADYILKLIFSQELWAPATLQALIYNDKSLDYEGDKNAKV